MPDFLTPAWVEACNAALAGVELAPPGPEVGLAASSGTFTVAEEIRGGPDGDVRLVLRVDGGSAGFDLGPLSGDGPEVEVTVALGYEDARALADGSLVPADALREGRIKVRGDLSVLVAAQPVLAEVRRRTRGAAAPRE